jgi:hypothetical protein
VRARGCAFSPRTTRQFASTSTHDRLGSTSRSFMIFSRVVHILKRFLDWVRCRCTSPVSPRITAAAAPADTATMAAEQPPTRDEFPYKLYVQTPHPRSVEACTNTRSSPAPSTSHSPHRTSRPPHCKPSPSTQSYPHSCTAASRSRSLQPTALARRPPRPARTFSKCGIRRRRTGCCA